MSSRAKPVHFALVIKQFYRMPPAPRRKSTGDIPLLVPSRSPALPPSLSVRQSCSQPSRQGTQDSQLRLPTENHSQSRIALQMRVKINTRRSIRRNRLSLHCQCWFNFVVILPNLTFPRFWTQQHFKINTQKQTSQMTMMADRKRRKIKADR